MNSHSETVALWVAKQLAEAPPIADAQRETAVRILSRPARRVLRTPERPHWGAA